MRVEYAPSRRGNRRKSSRRMFPNNVELQYRLRYIGCRYAAQMRQSAVYLHQTPQHHQQQRNQSLSRATMPPKGTGIRERSEESRIATLPEASCSGLRRGQREHVHQQHVMPHQSLQRHTEWVTIPSSLPPFFLQQEIPTRSTPSCKARENRENAALLWTGKPLTFLDYLQSTRSRFKHVE